MSRSVRLVLLSLSLFLVLFPLAAGRPGQPPTLKADEPAYLLMALSLAEDGDLRCETKDVQRAFDNYPYLPLTNLIVMSTDGWETVFFGKPYIYSLFAAPAVALLGINGFAAFNMLLLVAMVWMGAIYLSAFNSDSVAALFSAGFFLLSSGFAYVFWIHPEVFNMFSIAACLYLALHLPDSSGSSSSRWERFRSTLFGPRLRPLWSGAALVLGVYNKPMLAALGIPALWLFFRRDRWKGAIGWLAGAAIAMTAVVGIATALTGKPSAYLGVDRGGVIVERPEEFADAVKKIQGITVARAEESVNSWHWLFRFPKVDFGHLSEDGYYFLLGRHTGLVPYMPFAVLALLLFALYSRGSPERWLILGALVAVALYFLLWIPFNWHGGGGFVGNRYFINVYPAFLFLVTAIRPAWLPVVGSALGAIFLGSILFTPWGAPVPKASMQAHVRGGLFRYFPFELSLRHKIPNYSSFGFRGVGFLGRSDVFEVADEPTGVMWTRGATRTEIWLYSNEPLERMLFDVITWNPDNEIVLELPGVREVLSFDGATESPDNLRRVDLRPSEPSRVRRRRNGSSEYLYRMLVRSRTGRHQGGNMQNVMVKPLFYIGAQLNFIGTDERAARQARYHIAWEECSIPRRVEAASRFEMPVRVRNDGESTWGARGAYQVNLVYRWLDQSGARLSAPRSRLQLHHNVRPGESISKLLRVDTPETAGRYTLVLDAIRRNDTLFSRQGGATCEKVVRVVAPSGDGDDSGTAAE